MLRFAASLFLAAALSACATRSATPAAAGSVSSLTTLRVIGLNDFHGALEARPDASGRRRGGAAAVAGAIERARSECRPPSCESLVLDGGDQFQGTPASNLAYGRPVVEIFNRLDLAAAALGNHEFDWGQDTLRARMRDARYAFLASNVRYADGRDVPWIRDDTIISRGGVRVGVVGVITRETATSAKPTLISDLRFVEPAPIVDSLAAALRVSGADIVVVVAHAGAFCNQNACRGEIIDLARRLAPGRVDAIVSGHTHSRVNDVVNGIRIMQSFSRGLAIGVMDIPVANPSAATVEVRQIFTDAVAPSVIAGRIADAAIADVADKVNRPVATIAERMDRDSLPLGDLIADAFRAQGSGDFGILNNGSVRADLRAGTATYGDLFEVQPFGNILYRITASGAAMLAYFEKLVSAARPRGYLSGAVVTYDPRRPEGSRVASVRLADGRALDSAATYTVVINDFMLAGGVGLSFDAATVRVEALNLSDLDAFVEHVRSLPQPVSAPGDTRFVRKQP